MNAEQENKLLKTLERIADSLEVLSLAVDEKDQVLNAQIGGSIVVDDGKL